MGQLGHKAISKLTTYAVKHYSMRALGAKPELEVRIMIAEEMFQLYSSGRIPRTRHPRKVVAEVASRVYRHILTTAPTNENMAMLRDALGIGEGSRRSYTEMANDIQAYEIFCAHWGVDTSHHARAACEDAAYELLEIGHTFQNDKALAAGFDRLSKIHNDFREKSDDFAHTADTEVEFITDVTIVRPDADNISREGIEQYKKKYGKFLDHREGIATLIERDDGTYEVPEPVADDVESDEDFFERKEHLHWQKANLSS